MQRSGKILSATTFVLALLSSCSRETPPAAGDAQVMNGIKANICAATKAVGDGVYSDETGRLRFMDGDEIVITRMQRTYKPLSNYSYKDLHYVSQDDVLDRTDSQGKVYWSDNAQGHTFIGYSLPQSYPADRWTLVEGSFYEGNMSYTTEAGKNIVSFRDPETFDDEDVVFTHSADVTPDKSGYFALLHFYHGLSRVKIVVNIKGFAASSGAIDVATTVSDMVLKNQNIKYRWTQQDATLIAPNDNIKADIKMWCEDEDGLGSNDYKTFVFYGYTVPGVQRPGVDFTVTYPNASKPGQMVTHTYNAAMTDAVEFKSGYCTEIDIDLNHKNEKIIIGASFTEWENAKTPDHGNLLKNDCFMHVDDVDRIVLHGDAQNAHTASWLYTAEGGEVLDLHGNNGDSRENAYIISSGLEMQSFAAEVNNGYTFLGKWIKLDTDLFMQEKETSSNYNWYGIGDGTPEHTFQGYFMGQGCYIRRLKGSPLFHTIGKNAIIDHVRIETLSNYTMQASEQVFEANGLDGGTVALVNEGVICGCDVSGYVSGTETVLGLVRDNIYIPSDGNARGYGYILASYHMGFVEAEEPEGYYFDPDDITAPIIACFHFCHENIANHSSIKAADINAAIAVWNALRGTGGSRDYIWDIDEVFVDMDGQHPYIM